MKRFARLLQYMPLLLAISAGAQDPAPKPMPDVYGKLNITVSPIPGSEEHSLQLDWPAVDGTYYFVEHTEDLLEGFGSIKLFAGLHANPEGKLGLGLQSTAPMGFYRLFITDDESHPRLLADDDGDKISNLLEAKAGWDAYEQPADLILDTDNDGLPDYWEQFHFGNLNQDGAGDADGDGVSNEREFSFGNNPEAEETEQTVFELEVQIECNDFINNHPLDLWEDIYTDDVAFYHETAAIKRKQKYEGYWASVLFFGPEINEYNDWGMHVFSSTYKDKYDVYKGAYGVICEEWQGYYKLHSFSGKPLTLLVKHSEHEEIIDEDTLDKTTGPTGVVSYEVIHWDGESLTIDGEALELPTEERECKYEYGEVELPYRVEFIAPAGGANNDPVENPIDGGDGSGEVPNNANEFTFSTATPGVLTIPFKAKILGLELSKIVNDCVFTIENVGQAPTWAGANPGGKASISNGYLVATATFTGLPANNSDFGKKKVQLLIGGKLVTESEIEVFFPATATNHPGEGNGTTPNWFYYYKQNAGGGSYGYDPREDARSSSLSGLGESTILLAGYVHGGGKYITTKTVNNQLIATGWSSENKYYAHFIGVLEHERQHANNQINTGAPNDLDNDRLSNVFEENVSKTDPSNAWSAQGIFSSLSMSDQEVYAGGPVEENAIKTADTSQDWAAPGTNKE